MTDKQGDKTKKTGGGKDGGKDGDPNLAAQPPQKENHKVNDISDSQPSDDNPKNTERVPQSWQGEDKEDESK